ncbi:MAG TPA: hypothetical protein VE955_00530 [Candidatus Dormibacteraeota bacterium]|jgi:hypothetical protein|nr:hypothetical protein [Candidatus Dormibacteraeota bacterium]
MRALLLDLAIAGAVSGLVAVLLMTVFEFPFWHRFGMSGVVQWQVNEIMTSRLFSERYVEGKRLRYAIAMHLSHGITLGALFSILLALVPAVPLWTLLLAGVSYSTILWLIVPFSFRDRLQRAGKTRFTKLGIAVSFLAHLVYGFFLGGLLILLLG